QLSPHFGPNLCVPFAPAWPLPDGRGFDEWPLPGDGEQLDQLGLRHRPTLPAWVDLLVRLGYGVEWVGGKAVGLDAPVAERNECVRVGVAGAARHAFPGTGRKPAFQAFTLKIGRGGEKAVGGEPMQVAASVLPVDLRHSLGSQVFIES